MKVQVTIEVNDDQRLGIAAVVAGEFRPATRKEVVHWTHSLLAIPLTNLQSEVSSVRDQLVESLVDPKPSPKTKDGKPIKV